MKIPEQIKKPDLRFVLLGTWNEWARYENVDGKRNLVEKKFFDPKDYKKLVAEKIWKPLGKAPFERDWQNKGYRFDDPKLLAHIASGKNYGVIGGHGELRIQDVDDLKLIPHFEKELGETFTVETGSGGRHMYLFSDYETNHVLVGEGGELRAKNYQVVSAPCRHPNGEFYKVYEDSPIKKYTSKKVKEILKPYLRDTETTQPTQTAAKIGGDTSRSGVEFGAICKLIKKGLSKEKVFERMEAYSKWSGETEQYKDLTYTKAAASVLVETERKKSGVYQFLTSKGVNTKTGLEEFKVDIDKVAEHLISKHQFKTWFGLKSDNSFNWNEKFMEKNTRGIIKYECEELLEIFCKRNIVDEVFEKVKRKTNVEREDFERDDPNFINLNNGVWDIEKRKLLPHDPKYNFQYIIPVNKNGDPLKIHDCPNWIKFIGEALYPEDSTVMQEWFGFMLYREYFIKKALICEGPTDTGKSVLMDTGIKFIGEKNKTGLSLQKISGGSDFTKLSLKGKHLNVYDDLSSKDINDGGAFKVATGGGYISGEEKFGEYQQFRSFAKLWYNANKCPPVKDADDLAYYGRNILFKFDNVPEKLDPFLRGKLWTDKELSGILNWALEGLYRLLKNGKFSYHKTPLEVKQLMEESGQPLAAFTSDVLEREDGEIITKDAMFRVYSLWCNEQKKPRLSKEMLGRQLMKYCSFILSEKQKKRIWKNAKISAVWREKFKSCVDTDTSDTNKKVMSTFSNPLKTGNIKGNMDALEIHDISFKKVSEERQTTDTSDTNSEEDLAEAMK